MKLKKNNNSGKLRRKDSEKKINDFESIRLNRYISNAGICSRRDADLLISSGKIRVNDSVVTQLGTQVDSKDKVYYQNKLLVREKYQYILLNKPKGFITTMDDPYDRKTVMSLVENSCRERIYPVGRLDRGTTGLLLFTNDGKLAKKLTHPSHGIKKIYQVTIDKPVTSENFEKILAGLDLEDGRIYVNDLVMLDTSLTMLGIEISVGKNRIVHRIFEHFGYQVVKLDRVMFGHLTKKNLARGKYRSLTPQEIIYLNRNSRKK